MKNKKILYKILFAILIITFIMMISNFNVYATDSVINGADNFLEVGKDTLLDTGSIKEALNSIYTIFYVFGIAAVLIVGAVLGIQFIMGSVEQKAKIKEALVPYVTGSVVIFGAISIWILFNNVLGGVFGSLLIN